MRLLVALLISPVIPGPKAGAFELAAGFAAMEEGDDRIRPALAAHVGFTDLWVGRLYHYGREFGPVREDTVLAGVARQWGIFRSNSLVANAGLSLMDERTRLDFDPVEDGADSEDSHSYNLGGNFGVAFRLPPKAAGPLHLAVGWEGHVFPAGTALLALVTARKQAVYLTCGMALR